MPETARRPVLLVEDDIDLRESLAELLEGEGYPVLQAHNGREALALLGQARPFVILLDLMMPEMDGTQFLAALRERRSAGVACEIPVVVLTAAATHMEPNGEVRAVVRKPIRFERFLPLLHEICDESRT